MPKRKNTTLKVPKQMVELLGAYLPTVYEEHRIVVEFPLLNQMLPAIVLIDEPSEACDIQVVGVLLPEDAPQGQPFEDPVLAARIGVVGSLLRREINKCSVGRLVEQICASSWKGPPFAPPYQPEVENLIIHTIDRCKRKRRNWNEMEGELITALTGPVKKTRAWCPLAMIPDWFDLTKDDNWRLLDSWADWEDRKLSRNKRVDEFYCVRGACHERNRFKSRLRYLHLKAPPR